jgi:hypothetical protein
VGALSMPVAGCTVGRTPPRRRGVRTRRPASACRTTRLWATTAAPLMNWSKSSATSAKVRAWEASPAVMPLGTVCRSGQATGRRPLTLQSDIQARHRCKPYFDSELREHPSGPVGPDRLPLRATTTMVVAVEILPSARKHGISDDDIPSPLPSQLSSISSRVTSRC